MYQKVLPLFLVLFSLNIAYAKSDVGIETQIKKITKNENLVGLFWVTISNDHVEVGSTGYANISKLELMKPEQKMHVGSVTKSVLVMGVLHFIKEELIPTIDLHLRGYLSFKVCL
ncbi:MAG: hypothetical protein ACJAXS_000336 [Colwellia sp.]|jgi:hypothetical protein